MIHSALRRPLAALIIAAALFPAAASAAPLNLARLDTEPGFFAWLRRTITALWQEAGGGLDPSGCPGTSSAEEGGGLDPDGRP
jgi:hypothetical protein